VRVRVRMVVVTAHDVRMGVAVRVPLVLRVVGVGFGARVRGRGQRRRRRRLGRRDRMMVAAPVRVGMCVRVVVVLAGRVRGRAVLVLVRRVLGRRWTDRLGASRLFGRVKTGGGMVVADAGRMRVRVFVMMVPRRAFPRPVRVPMRMLVALVSRIHGPAFRRMMVPIAIRMGLFVRVVVVLRRVVRMRVRMVVGLVRDRAQLRRVVMVAPGRMRVLVRMMVVVVGAVRVEVRMGMPLVPRDDRPLLVRVVVPVARRVRVLVRVVLVVGFPVRMDAVIVLVVDGGGGLAPLVMMEHPRLVRVLVRVVVVSAALVRMRVRMPVAVVGQSSHAGLSPDGCRNEERGDQARHSPCSWRSASSAVCAARCSASFLLRPRPRATSRPATEREISKVSAWSGPSWATSA